MKPAPDLYCFTSVIIGVQHYFSRLWGTDISDTILFIYFSYLVQIHVILLKEESIEQNIDKTIELQDIIRLDLCIISKDTPVLLVQGA